MISKEFRENIESGDLMTVRSALLDDLIIDRTFRTFDEDFKAANENLDILVPYDDEPFERDPEKWDKEYLNQQKVALMVNFSEERIVHLKKVIKKVMPLEKTKESGATTSHQTFIKNRTGRVVTSERVVGSEKKSRRDSRMVSRPIASKTTKVPRSGNGRTGRTVIKKSANDRNNSGKKKTETDGIGSALILCGTATTVTGVAMSEPIIIGAGIVVAGVGACVKLNNRR